MKIGVFDSGIGGTTVLAEIKKQLAHENVEFLYIADSKNCPYGEKNDDELYKIVCENVEKLRAWGAKVIVIACNTATTKCITQLRKDYSDLFFVGTEPAIKLATDSDYKNILVLATPGTIAAERTLELVRENKKPWQKISLLPCPGLADTIEKYNETAPEKVRSALGDLLINYFDKETTASKFDAVVLGCTHYPLIRDLIQGYFPKAKLIDGNKGVAKMVEAIYRSNV